MFDELQTHIERLEDLNAEFEINPTIELMHERAELDRRIVYLEEILKWRQDETVAA